MDGKFEKDVKALVKRARALPAGEMEESLEIAGQIGAAVLAGGPCCGKYMAGDAGESTLFDDWLVEIETIRESMKSLKDFDETTAEED